MSLNKIISVALLLSAFIFGLASCSKDDEPRNNVSSDQNQNAGSNNFTDVAVTGSATNITYSSAKLNGYINIDKASVVQGETNYEMGICVTDKEDWKESDLNYYYTNIITGRSISVEVDNLNPYTEYYYFAFFRIKSGNNINQWVGQPLKFTTQDFSNITDVELIVTSTKSVLFYFYVPEEIEDSYEGWEQSQHWGVAIAKDRDQFNDEGRYDAYLKYPGFLAIDNLQPDTEYYYCALTKYGDEIRFGNPRSFTTVINNPNLRTYTEPGEDPFTSVTVFFTVNGAPTEFVTDSKVGFYLAESEEDLLSMTNVSEHQVKNWENKSYTYYNTLTKLQSDKTYYYQGYFKSRDYVIFLGNINSFTTQNPDNLIKTENATYSVLGVGGSDTNPIVWIQAEFYSELTSSLLQDYNIIEYGIALRTECHNDNWFDWSETYFPSNNLNNGKFSVSSDDYPYYDIWGSPLGTTYFYRAYCKIDAETIIYGKEKSFTVE